MSAGIVRHLTAAALAAATIVGVNVGLTASAAAVPRVQSDVHTVVVNWGSYVDPAQAAGAAGVLDALDNSGYLHGLAAAYSLSSRARYLGAGVVPDASLPSTTSDSTIEAAVAARISAGALPSPVGSTNYVVMLPNGTSPGNSTGPTFCSSHHPFRVGSRYAYVIVVADYTDTVQQCGEGAQDPAGAVTVNVSRQVVNAITDPSAGDTGQQQTGTGAELGDACAAVGATGDVDGFAVQPWWNNRTGGCSFGDTGVSVTGDVGNVTNARLATFRLHDTAPTVGRPSFTCTLDHAAQACDVSRPLALTGVAAGEHVLDVNAGGLGDATYSWLVDLAAPTAKLTAPTAPVTVGKTVTVSYSGADTGGSGVAAYDVRYRTAAWNGGLGRWVQPAAWQATAASHRVLPAQPGHVYCFSVRAHDRADNVSPSWSSTRCTTVPVDDRTFSATGWRRVASATAFRGTLSVSTTTGATLRLAKAHVRRLALVVRTCPNCGRLDVYRGHLLWRSVSTRSARVHSRVVITLPAIGLRTTTISLKVAGSGKPLYVDGVAVLQT